MTDRVLVVEDDQDIAQLIKVNLAELAIEAHLVDDGDQALALALNEDYDLILLDVMLPGMSGLDICRTLRQAKPEQVIMMLTSRNSETDRVVGLELGADDYMTKPFSVRELQARVRSHLRRVHLLSNKQSALMPTATNQATAAEHSQTSLSALAQINIGLLSINSKSHRAHIAEQELNLTSTEFELLQFFANHPEQVFSRSQLLNSVWGYQHSGYEHTVNSHINRLRSKLEADLSDPQIIQTVWGVGYKFNPQGVMQASVAH